ncbi:histone-lysine N-methyltransferase SETMAR-like [Hydra vulgaris]|uniref:Histone-lysine N-methyltransferase SETMAR-like n=1 Tax=Hydra vulgaris TaxID=6087 RepID=A0ABM4B2M0_HYDVU
MFYIFFKTTGVVHLGYVEKGDTITSEYYIKNCLKPRICEINKQRPKTGTQSFKFLHNNAQPHVTKTVTNCLNQAGITIIRYPPYSPDLAPSDYWLFDLIKKNLVNDTDVESQKTRITKLLQSIPKEEYKKMFDKWLERMQLCIDNDGHYFEHLIK